VRILLQRFALSSVLATLVVIGVLLLMQSLIATARSQLVTSNDRHFVNFVRVERDESVQRRERKRDRPPEPKSPPPSALQPRLDAVAPVAVDLPVSAPSITTDLDLGGFGIGAGDGNYLPIVKIEPTYPMTALQRQIEGYCIVEYTVTTTGAVRDVQVIEADPPDIFNRASVEAARKFKYKPRIVNGEAIEVVGVRNIFRYQLERR
jgi:protein TonB